MRGVDGADDLRESRPLVLDLQPLARVGDSRRLVPDGLEKPGHAVSLGRRTHQNRHDVPFAQLARQIVEHQVLWRFDVANELLHQGVVVVGELFEHRKASLLLLRDDARRHLDHG